MTPSVPALSFEAARAPRAPLAERLLHIDPRARSFSDRGFSELPSLLHSGDLVVVNDAATLPASLRTTNGAVEIRLLSREPD